MKEIDNDDRPIGHILSRREVLAALGSIGAATLLGACVMPTGGPPVGANETNGVTAGAATQTANLPTGCVVRPELTEGPLFVEEDLNRSDIRLDPSNGVTSAGAQLDLIFRVSQVAGGACAPLAGVQVDVWHCDAQGIYSDTSQLGMETVGQKFLRGYQVTDANGIAKFTTIYPGWYAGRAVHIHFKLRTQDGYDFTSQLFFDETLTSQVYQQEPYASRGEPPIKHADDNIFAESGGQTILSVNQAGAVYNATFDVALDMA
jgi:protocatechuate 3,4-dioxygenase beta subunit